MPDPSAENIPTPSTSITPDESEPVVIPVQGADGARFELLCVLPAGDWHRLLYWIPAMGMPARHYLPLAQALAVRGTAVVVHE